MAVAGRKARLALGAALALAMGCSSTTDDGGGGGDAEDFETQLGEAFTNNLAGFAESLERLLAAVAGNPQDGVTITPTANGATASVGVDVNGDGSLETSVNGSITYLNPEAGFAGGATLVISSITGGAPQTANGQATIAPLGPASISITNGSFETHTDTRGNDLYLANANLVVDASGSQIHATGSAQFEFNDLEGTLTFLNPASGYAIQVSGPGFETFTIP
jgi:hypothetical protein